MNSREPRFARHPLGISIIISSHQSYDICLHLTVASLCSAPFRHLLNLVSITRYCALRARGAREAGFFFDGLISFVKAVTLFYWSVALKSRFEAAYVVSLTRFSALRVRRAHEAGFFFMDHFFCQDNYFILMVRSSKMLF